MSARTKRRAAERSKLAAELCKVAPSEWLVMSRSERRRRLRLARAVNRG
ncbi:hypothetical protein [Actinoplanes italicus]|nr:hypothetical protein [Actinoplanes italicus]